MVPQTQLRLTPRLIQRLVKSPHRDRVMPLADWWD